LDQVPHPLWKNTGATCKAAAIDAFCDAMRASYLVWDGSLEGDLKALSDYLFLSQLKGDVLELAESSAPVHAALTAMPPECWAALQSYAQASGAKGILSVGLSQVQARDVSLVAALKHLHLLERVTIRAAGRGDRIDLSCLQGVGPQGVPLRLAQVDIVAMGFEPDQVMDIVVGPGVAVRAESLLDPVLKKSQVHVADAQGKIDHSCKPRPIHGLVQDHTAKDFSHQPGESALQVQRRARGIHLNFQADMKQADLWSGTEVERKAKCRDLTGLWLHDRIDHQAAKAQAAAYASAGPGPFPYEKNFGDVPQIASRVAARAQGDLVNKSTEADYQRMLRNGPCELFAADSFGQSAADQLQSLKPGESAHFALDTVKHMMGLELKVRERWDGAQMRREYVVNLYDPNDTATHRHLVVGDLADLRSMRLRDFLGADAVRGYCFEPAICRLFGWPPAHSAVGKPLNRLSREARASGLYLRVVAESGLAEEVKESIQLLQAKYEKQPDELKRQLLAQPFAEEAPLLQRIVDPTVTMQPGAVAVYAEAILDIPSRVLDSEAKRELLTAQWKGAPALAHAIEMGGEPATVALAGALLNAPFAR
jgi:hypothetical protein